MHVFAAVPQRKIIELYATLMRQCRIACMTHYITTNVFSAITPEAGTDHCPAHCILQGGKSCCVPCSLLAFKKRQANLKTMPNGNYTSSTYRACKHRASAAAQSHQHPASRLQNQEHPCAYVGWALAAAKRIHQHQPGADQRGPHKQHHFEDPSRASSYASWPHK